MVEEVAVRDHRKLAVFHKADELARKAYSTTEAFPRSEMFGLVSQIRRAAVSIPANIVEGCARATEADYVHFLHIALRSARELGYMLELASDLKLVEEDSATELASLAESVSRLLNSLIRSLRRREDREH